VSTVVLLGPQRFTPTLGEAVAAAGVKGRLASITAGWQERESEDLELHEHLGERTVNLRLYARAEELFSADPELFRAHRERQDRLREQQRLYRARLGPMRQAARRLFDEESVEPALLEAERADAISALARLDAHHLRRVLEIDDEFERRFRPAERPQVRRQGAEIDRALEGVEALAIAGGHVAVLINRLRLFGIRERIGRRALFAWSAGAMAVSDRIVLFHDSPPQGQGATEVLESGLGLAKGIVPLPHARRRLRLNDPIRVALHARRYAPASPLAFEDGARLHLQDGVATVAVGVSRLGEDGSVSPLEVP